MSRQNKEGYSSFAREAFHLICMSAKNQKLNEAARFTSALLDCLNPGTVAVSSLTWDLVGTNDLLTMEVKLCLVLMIFSYLSLLEVEARPHWHWVVK